jgi:hypothetical protein
MNQDSGGLDDMDLSPEELQQLMDALNSMDNN